MTMTTPAAIDDVVGPLRALYGKATACPWIAKEPAEDGSVYIDADEDGDYPIAMMMSGSPHNRDIHDAALIVAAVNALPSLLALITSLAKERDEAAEQRDALLSALGWKVGPFRAAGVRKVILEDSAGLRPEMVKARGRAQEAEANSAFWQYLAGERVYATQSGFLIRVWEKLKDMRRQFRAATARADAAEREVERVREVLHMYGKHGSNCSIMGYSVQCDCGLAAALSPVGGV